MTYCCRRDSSTGSKSLIPRASTRLNWRIGNSFAYKSLGSIVGKATHRALFLIRPYPHPRETDSAVSHAVRSAGLLLTAFEAAASENKLTGVPSWPVGRITPAGGW